MNKQQFIKANEITGIIWETTSYGGYSIDFPARDDDKYLSPAGKKILMDFKPKLLLFLEQYFKPVFKLWRCNFGRKDEDWGKKSWEEFLAEIQDYEWLEISIKDEIVINTETEIEIPRLSIGVFGFCEEKTPILYEFSIEIPSVQS